MFIGIEDMIVKDGIYRGFISNCNNLTSLYVQLLDNEVELNHLHDKINQSNKNVIFRNIQQGLYTILLINFT